MSKTWKRYARMGTVEAIEEDFSFVFGQLGAYGRKSASVYASASS